MSLIINHNISALNTQRNLKGSSRMLAKSLEKLSSGFKINVAADDPSGLIISEQLRSQTNGLERAVRNSQEALNVLGIAEGALIEMNEILRKMRALALHAANAGITAPDQVAADQAELDSSIQTIDRIASATRYSDQFLLNGSKGLVFDRTTTVNDSMDHQLLNTKLTRVDQVFKREGVAMNVAFSGAKTATQADTDTQTTRAMFEADNANSDAEINGNELTSRQEFILTGTKGSRLFNFAAGSTLGTMVESMNNIADSTGVEAQLIFASDTRPDETLNDPVNNIRTGARTAGDAQVYGADINSAAPKVSDVTITSIQDFEVGVNTDAHGRLFAKVTSVAAGAEEVEWYKDADLTMLVGTQSGIGGGASFTAANSSGVTGVTVDFVAANTAVDDVFTIGLVGQEIDTTRNLDASIEGLNTWNNLDLTDSVISGVELGRNTSADGTLYFRASGVAANRTIEVFRSADMLETDLVAKGTMDLSAAATRQVRVEGVTLEDGKNSNLNMTLDFSAAAADGIETGTIQFNNLGIRLSSQDYGSQEFVRVQNLRGQFWQQYTNGESTDYEMIDEGATAQVEGTNAEIVLNGSPLGSDGLTANVTTPDFTGALTFNEGKLGETTIAKAGYNIGSLFSRAGSLQSIDDTKAGAGAVLSGDAEAANVRNHLLFSETDTYQGNYYMRLTGAGTAAATVSIYSDAPNANLIAQGTFDDTLGIGVTELQLLEQNNSGITGTIDLVAAWGNTGANIVMASNTLVSTYTNATNARGSTEEVLDNFIGGMQFQLGAGEGDQERTVFSIQSMAAANLGNLEINDEILTLQDVLAGGRASLANDPIAALRIVTEAVNDVSDLRARLGAVQKNLLQTNINSLEVSVEKITMTESAIRDANMAVETTDFTKNQILLQAGTAMLAQANTASQNILQLLG